MPMTPVPAALLDVKHVQITPYVKNVSLIIILILIISVYRVLIIALHVNKINNVLSVMKDTI